MPFDCTDPRGPASGPAPAPSNAARLLRLAAISTALLLTAGCGLAAFDGAVAFWAAFASHDPADILGAMRAGVVFSGLASLYTLVVPGLCAFADGRWP